MPAKGDYTLFWYHSKGTDDAIVTPGFKTLDMCNYAGRNMKRVFDGKWHDDSSWFECAEGCRPLENPAGPDIAICRH